MPGRDGTGPMGAGAGTGKGMGGCVGTLVNGQYPVYGIGCQRRGGRGGMQGRGFGRGLAGVYPAATQKNVPEQRDTGSTSQTEQDPATMQKNVLEQRDMGLTSQTGQDPATTQNDVLEQRDTGATSQTGQDPASTQKEALEQQRAALQARLDQVDGQLKNL